MSAAKPAPRQAYCPVCGEPLAPGTRNPARYCGDGACRQAAHKRKKRLEKRFLRRPREQPVAAPDNTLAAMALRARFGPGASFSAEQARIVAGRSGVHLDAVALANLLRELVEDVLRETVTVSVSVSGQRFSFPSTKRPSLRGYARTNRVRPLQPKRGARAGASHGVTVSSGLATPPAPTPPAPQAPAPKALGRKAVVPDPLVKLIGPPTVDGFTSFKLLVKEDHWAESLRHLVAASASGGRNALPPTVDLADADGEVCTAIVRYGDHGCVSLEFSDEAQLDLYAKQGFAVLITKANALWSNGLTEWMTTWFDRASWLLRSLRCPSPKDAALLGWKTSRLELCADFTGLQFFDEDVTCFVGARGGPKRIGSHGFKFDHSVETINSAGRRRHCLAMSTHDKTQKLHVEKVRPEASVYSPTWRGYGWDGKSVRRVEIRAAGRALLLVGSIAPSQRLDLRSPDALLDESLLRAFWREATQRFRLVTPPSGGNDLRHQPVDPRWGAVQNAGGDALAQRFVVDRSEVRRLDLAELRERERRLLIKVLARVVGLGAGNDVARAVRRHVEDVVSTPEFSKRFAAARHGRDARLRHQAEALRALPDT